MLKIHEINVPHFWLADFEDVQNYLSHHLRNEKQ